MPDVHIAILLMVKNETKRLRVTLQSVLGHVQSIVAFDTGSSDDTIQILQDFSDEHNIPLRLKEGDFVDFSTSRNVSLDFADTFEDIDYLLLLDCNDELRGGKNLRKFAEDNKHNPVTGFLVCQEWWSGKYDKYYNIRFVKAREGWRYRGSVHEWMKNTKYESDDVTPPVLRIPAETVLYQDRTQDDDKSGKRFTRDKVLLLNDHKKDPNEPRTLFYLAQTCSCLNQLDDAFYYYKLRSKLEGFQEEKFHSFLRAGEISVMMKHPWHDSMAWFMKAFEHSNRVEPLIKIINHYQETNNWLIAYTFANLACNLNYPEYCILFVDKHAYDYTRWHNMGIVAYYVGHYRQGREACEQAIAQGLNSELDTNNLKFYIDKEKELQHQQETTDVNMTKRDFLNIHVQKLTKENPTLSQKQIAAKANRMWKLRNKPPP